MLSGGGKYQHITKPPNICVSRSWLFPSQSTEGEAGLGFRFFHVRTGALIKQKAVFSGAKLIPILHSLDQIPEGNFKGQIPDEPHTIHLRLLSASSLITRPHHCLPAAFIRR